MPASLAGGGGSLGPRLLIGFPGTPRVAATHFRDIPAELCQAGVGVLNSFDSGTPRFSQALEGGPERLPCCLRRWVPSLALPALTPSWLHRVSLQG